MTGRMTRQHFQLIADVIRELIENNGEDIPAHRLIQEFGSALYGTNSAFDRGRFERACRGLK
jgi:hypothetical protein